MVTTEESAVAWEALPSDTSDHTRLLKGLQAHLGLVTGITVGSAGQEGRFPRGIMRILLLTQLFQPEPNHLKGLAFAQALQRAGHEVEVLTGFPNYPGGRLYAGYRLRLWQREVVGGVPVIRVLMYPSHDASGVRRFACYVSLALAASLTGPFLVRRPDVVHVYQGPATLVLPAVVLKCLFRSPYVLDVQDLWPDSVIGSGMLRVPGGRTLLEWWSRFSYRGAARVVVLSDGYCELLIKRGVGAARVDVVSNWCDEETLRADKEGADEDCVGADSGFEIVYAGNMGAVQGLESVLEAARLLASEMPDVRFVFVGDGVDADGLKKKASQLALPNVRLLPRQPAERVGKMLARAGALLIHVKDVPLTRVGIPQKTQAYLAMGKPLLVAARGSTADLVRRAGAGVFAEPEDAESLADAVRRLVRMRAEERQALGESGRRFYEKELSFRVGTQRMIGVFESVVGAAKA